MKYWILQSRRKFSYRRIFRSKEAAEQELQRFQTEYGSEMAACLHIREELRYDKPKDYYKPA